MEIQRYILYTLNPLPPSDAVRKQEILFQRVVLVQNFQTLKIIAPLETWNLIIEAFSKA